MNILVIAGYCLKVNSSANLCHAKYIEGLVQGGHQVDLLTVSDQGLNADRSISLPMVNRIFAYKASLYERKSPRKDRSNYMTPSGPGENQIIPKGMKQRVKEFVRGLYGVYGTDAGWMLRAKRFRSSRKYDLLISLAYPPVSHRLAEYLIDKKRVCTKRWIQIWEDPWYADLSGMTPTARIWEEEARILRSAEVIYYVSPLTLAYQKQYFPDSAAKMKWQPLPSYYGSETEVHTFDQLCFGYFGDYSPNVRNLRVFYEYAVENNLTADICGNSSDPYLSSETVNVYPRMSLKQLRVYERKANVLVFVCNLRGGQIPGKIYQYSATNKYILFILDGTDEEMSVLRQYFEQFHRYVFCYNRKGSIGNAIKKIEQGEYPKSYCTAIDAFAPSKIVDNIIHGR